MLKKIVEIKNIGRFRNYKAEGDVELKRFNLVYGENGRGKTTLCSILRSLQAQEANHIQGRSTLGSSDKPAVHIVLANGQAQFKNDQWTQGFPHIEIFDNTFITENVYSGDAVGAEQKRNLYKVIIGKKGVALAESLEGKVKDIRDLTAKIRNVRKTVETHLIQGMKIDDFLKYEKDNELLVKIKNAEASLKIAKEAILLKQKKECIIVPFPKQPDNLAEVLEKTIKDVSAEAERVVQNHVKKHEMRTQGQEWLSQGLQYKLEEGCPFCGQNLEGLELIKAYQGLFSETYKQLKNGIAQQGKQLKEQFSDQIIMQLANYIEENNALVEFWSEYCKLEPLPVVQVDMLKSVAIDYREQLLNILRLKVLAPLEAIKVDENYKAAAERYIVLLKEMSAYNDALKKANVAIDLFKKGLATSDQAKAQNDLNKLLLLKKRHEAPIKELCDEVFKLEEDKDRLEKERDKLKVQLDTESANIVSKYQSSINTYLENFNAGFSIQKIDHNYVGGVNASYQIMINNVGVALGDSSTPLDTPSFKNTLSSGDKSALALAFFLAQLDHDSSLAQKVVIFDDPFNSQDHFRTTQTALEIMRCGEKCAQIFVLSHNAHFLKQLAEKHNRIGTSPSVKVLKMNPIGLENTALIELDLDKMLRSELRALVEMLQAYHTNGSASGHSATNIIQKIRPLLEGHCKNSCIMAFDANDNLSDILTKIRTVGATHSLWILYGELDDINEYTKKHHHYDGTISGAINDTELLGVVRRTLRAVSAL